MENIEKIIKKYWFLIILVVSMGAAWALLVKGYFGASDDLHIAWLYELDRALKLGQIPPRFVPDLSFGFGYPLFNFVFPLPFYIAEAFHLIGFSLVDSIKAVFFISIPLSGIFMYLLIREFTEAKLALVGAILYIYTPYRAVDLYIRGAIGEILSFVFLPLIILAVVKLEKSFSRRWVGVGGLSLAALVLSHNITAYMFFPFVFLLVLLMLFFSARKISFLASLSLMVLLSLSTSSFFWLSALSETGLVKYDTVFNFVDHYPTIKQLFTPYWGYGASVPGPGDGMSFFLGALNILLLFAGIILGKVYWKGIVVRQKILFVWIYMSLGLVFILMNYRSIFIWNNIPLIPFFQFPWRFLIMTTFLIPLLVIFLERIKLKPVLLLIFIVINLATSYFFFWPQDFLGREDNYYLNRYVPYPDASEEYLKTQEEYLRLPKDTEKRPDAVYPLVFPQNNVTKITKVNDLDIIFYTQSKDYSEVSINKYFFPGWEGRVDGTKAQLFAGKPFGQVTLIVPPGEHKVEVSFQETNFKKILNFASLAAFLVLLVLVFI